MDKGTIKLNDVSYVVDLRSYKRRDIIDFSPRTSIAGGSVYSELGLYQTLTLNDWQGGFGFPWHTATKSNVYLRTEGAVDTRHAGYAMLMTKPSTTARTFYVKDFMTFAGDVYAWSSQGAIKYTTSDAEWTTDIICTDALNSMWHNGYHIFAVRTGKTPLFTTSDVTNGWGIFAGVSSDATSSDWESSWIQTGVSWDQTTDGAGAADTDQIGVYWLHNHDGYVFAGQETGSDNSSGHYVSYDDSLLLDDLYTVSSDDPSMIPVGVPGMQIEGAESFRGDLMLMRGDAIYRMNKDRASATKIIDYGDQASSENFRSWADYNGQFVFPVRDKLYQWNGQRVVPMDPPHFEDQWPLMQYGHFDNFEKFDRWLFMTARTSLDEDGNWEEHLLSYDGVGWHNLYPLVSSTDGLVSVTALHYDPYNDYLWIAKTGQGSTDVIDYLPFQARSRYPYEQFPTSTDEMTNKLRFPKIAAGYRKVKKSTPAVLLEGMNLSSGQYLELYYRMDGSTVWLPWGADSGVSNVLTSDGVKLFNDPLGEDKSTLEYNYIEYSVDFVTDNSTGTPIMTGFYPRLLMRPDHLFGWSMLVTASKDAQYGTGKDDKTAYNILEDLQDARGSYGPVDYRDVYGDEYKVYISAINESAVEQHVDRPGPRPDVEQAVQINLVQVG